MIGAPEFQMMKRSSIMINTSRGAVVDHAALYAALQEGTIGGAALDVTEPEPIGSDDPLLTLNVIAGLRGDRLPHCVNPEVYQ